MAAPAPAGEFRDPDRHARERHAQDRHETALERRCAERARSAGALRRAFAAVAGRFVDRKAWEPLAFARAGDYARERLGLSARALHDLARVDAALGTLPKLERALVTGALPWTKVRLVARTARPEDEACWIAHARTVSVRTLEQTVRACDAGSVEAGAARAADGGATKWKKVYYRVSPGTAAKWQFGWRLVRRVAGENLDRGRCAEWMAAEALSALPMEPGADVPAAPIQGMSPAERGRARREQRQQARHCNPARLPPFVRGLIEGLADADPKELDRRLRRAVALEQRFEADLGPLLERVAALHLYVGRGFRSLEAYAADRLGLSPRKVWALVRLERTCQSCPELRSAYRNGQLSWVQAQTLLPVLKLGPVENAAWIAWARRTMVRRLRDDVDRALLLAGRDFAAFRETAGLPPEARLQTGANDTISGATTHRPDPGDWHPTVSFLAEADVARLFRATVCTVQRHLRLKNADQALDALFEHCFRAWGIRDPKQERLRKRRYPIQERDGWICAVPGCTSHRNLQSHHKRFRSHGGDDDEGNLITLCAWHHHRAVHEQRVLRITGRGRTRFEMPLGTYEDGDVLISTSNT